VGLFEIQDEEKEVNEMQGIKFKKSHPSYTGILPDALFIFPRGWNRQAFI